MARPKKEMPRDFYLPEGINCDPFSFNQECQALNAKYGKNQTYGEIKAHHYIVSFDPNDRDENGLTPERAQELGMELAKNQMIRLTGQYYANKSVYGQFLKAKNKSRFRSEHESEIRLYEAARKGLKELSGGEKLPTLKMLREEKAHLTQKKNALYEDYSMARATYREIQTVSSNVDMILGTNHRDLNQSKERS